MLRLLASDAVLLQSVVLTAEAPPSGREQMALRRPSVKAESLQLADQVPPAGRGGREGERIGGCAERGGRGGMQPVANLAKA